MKRIKVSNNVIRRMPRYLRKLDDLNAAGIERISSGELGRQMGLTPSQIRQDFSCFGEFGQQGYGYNVVALRGEVAKILGMDRNYSAVLVGVGNIGRALVENFCFEQYGFTLKAAFDIKPDLIGKEMHGIAVHDFSTLDDIRAVAAAGADVIEGAITGRALYEGNFTLAEALAVAHGEESAC